MRGHPLLYGRIPWLRFLRPSLTSSLFVNLTPATATAKITPHPHQHQGLRSALGCRDGRWGAAQGHWSKPWFQKLGESSWPSVSCRCKPVESIASTGREAPSGQSFSKPGLTMNIQPKKGPQHFNNQNWKTGISLFNPFAKHREAALRSQFWFNDGVSYLLSIGHL